MSVESICNQACHEIALEILIKKVCMYVYVCMHVLVLGQRFEGSGTSGTFKG